MVLDNSEMTNFTLHFRGSGKEKSCSGSTDLHNSTTKIFYLGTGTEKERNAWVGAFRQCMLVEELVKQHELPKTVSVPSLVDGSESLPRRKQKSSVLSAMSAAATAASQVLKAQMTGAGLAKGGMDVDGKAKVLRTNVSMNTLNSVGPCLSVSFRVLFNNYDGQYKRRTHAARSARPSYEFDRGIQG